MPPSEITIQPAWKSYFVFYAAIVIFGLGPMFNPEAPLTRPSGFLVAAVLIVFVILKRNKTVYRFSEQGVSKEIRWGGQAQTRKLPLSDLASVAVRRGVVHRLIGVGHLQFRANKAGAPDLWWYGVDRPFEVKEKIETAWLGKKTE